MQQAFLVVRHCEASGQAPDAALTPQGEAQAVALGEFLAGHPVDHIVSSPYLRAQASIEPFAARSGLPVHLHEGLAERRMPLQPIEQWREAVRLSFVDPTHRIPGGESAADVLDRARTAIQSVLQGAHRLPVLVSHGQLLSLVLHAIDSNFGHAGWDALTNPDIFLVEVDDGGQFAFRRLWT